MLLLDQLTTCLTDVLLKNQVRQSALGRNDMEQLLDGLTVAVFRLRRCAVGLLHEIGGEPLRQHVVLPGTLLGDQCFNRLAEQGVVAARTSTDKVYQQVSPGHDVHQPLAGHVMY